jgi:hypothetical protein
MPALYCSRDGKVSLVGTATVTDVMIFKISLQKNRQKIDVSDSNQCSMGYVKRAIDLKFH